jgi:hypothetical protein
MPDADVAVGVDHLFFRQDPVRDHQIADRSLQIVHERSSRKAAPGDWAGALARTLMEGNEGVLMVRRECPAGLAFAPSATMSLHGHYRQKPVLA